MLEEGRKLRKYSGMGEQRTGSLLACVEHFQVSSEHIVRLLLFVSKEFGGKEHLFVVSKKNYFESLCWLFSTCGCLDGFCGLGCTLICSSKCLLAVVLCAGRFCAGC